MSDCPRLLLITPDLPSPVLTARVVSALDVLGARADILLRRPDLGDGQLMRLASTLRAETRRRGARLLLSRRADLAALVGADGVHLPERGLRVDEARQLLPEGSIVGCSRHDPEGLATAAAQGADYATLSPVFDVPGKGEPLGLPRFARWTRAAGLPIVALGGLNPDRAREVLAGGAWGVAVRRCILGREDAAEAAHAWIAGLDAESRRVDA